MLLISTGSCDEIKECLKNPHVRKIMVSLVTSTNPDKAIEEAMQEPIFTELAVAALKVVEPQTFELASQWRQSILISQIANEVSVINDLTNILSVNIMWFSWG